MNPQRYGSGLSGAPNREFTTAKAKKPGHENFDPPYDWSEAMRL
jgi:hypothetical protein